MPSIYSYPVLYRLAMRLAYGSEYHERCQLLADQIAGPSDVLELCCGDLVLHDHLLRRGLIRSYCGLDINPGMLALAHRRGVHVETADLRAMTVPRAEVIVMQASLYQFQDIAETLLRGLWNAAQRQLLIAEPVRNLSTSTNAVVRRIGRLLSRTEAGAHAFRYTEPTLIELYGRAGVPITRRLATTHGREVIVSSIKSS